MDLLTYDKNPWHVWSPAVYFFLQERSGGRRVVYVGKAKDLGRRVCSHGHHVRKRGCRVDDIAYLPLWGGVADRDLEDAESYFIHLFRPEQNRKYPNPCWCGCWVRALVSSLEPAQNLALRRFLTNCPFPRPLRGEFMLVALLKELDRHLVASEVLRPVAPSMPSAMS